MTGLAKVVLVVVLLLVAANLFLLFEIHKINGSLASLHSVVNQLQKETSQNQKDINNFKTGAVYNYIGGG